MQILGLNLSNSIDLIIFDFCTGIIYLVLLLGFLVYQDGIVWDSRKHEIVFKAFAIFSAFYIAAYLYINIINTFVR